MLVEHFSSQDNWVDRLGEEERYGGGVKERLVGGEEGETAIWMQYMREE